MTEPTPELVLRMLLHDLRSPLVALTYNAQMLLELEDLGADGRDLAEDLLGAAQQAQRTIQAAVEIRRKLEGTLAPASGPVDLRPLVRDAVQAFERRGGERGQQLVHDGALHLAGDPPAPGGQVVARTDRDLARLLVDTLLDLALRIAPRDTAIRVWLGTDGAHVDLQIQDQRGPERGSGQSIGHLLVGVASAALGVELHEEARGGGHLTRLRFPKA